MRCSGSKLDWSFDVTPAGKLYWSFDVTPTEQPQTGPSLGQALVFDAASIPAGEGHWFLSITAKAVLKSVTISEQPCKDPRSDKNFSYHTQVVKSDGQLLQGCCGPL